MSFKLLSEKNFNLVEGNYVNLPHMVLEKLNKKGKELPYFFEIKTESLLNSYVGVREFTSEKDTIEIPYWLLEQLGIDEGNQVLEVKLLENVPKGSYIKLRPESEDFFEIIDYESCLETKLSGFPILYQGQKIEVDVFDKKYLILVEEIEHDWNNFDFEKGTDSLELNVIDVINTDLQVDISNKFLKRKLEEEKKLKEDELVKQKEKYQKRLNDRELQKARIEEPTENKVTNVFSGVGIKLSEEKLDEMDIRRARSDFLKKFEK